MTKSNLWEDNEDFYRIWQNIVCEDNSRLTQDAIDLKDKILEKVLNDEDVKCEIERSGTPIPKYDTRPYLEFQNGDTADIDPCELVTKIFYCDIEPPHIHAMTHERESILDIDTGEILTMGPVADEIETLPNMILKVRFEDGVVKFYDIKPLMEQYEDFKELQDENKFNAAYLSPAGHGIIWNSKLDLAIEEIYNNGVLISS